MIDNKLLEDVLEFYHCPCKVIDTTEGGGYEDYILSPINGTTINKLSARVNDFTAAIGQNVSIAFENMRIIFRVKARGSQTVYNYFDYINNLSDIDGMIGFGVSPRGEWIEYNLFDMPHLLVAGATGSGKSVFLHSAILNLVCHSAACLTLIDLKRTELSIYNGLNFVSGKVITEAEAAKNQLLHEVAEMETRYKIMEKYHARHYTDLPPKWEIAPRVIIIDELADLMLNKATRKSVENSIVRIAQLGRAAGCHLILAAQRPSTDVITGLIKANIPCKLAFMTANAIDSRVIGVKGADQLNGKGDALLSIAGHKELERVQSLYLSSEVLNDFLDRVRREQPRRRYRKMGLFQRLFG